MSLIDIANKIRDQIVADMDPEPAPLIRFGIAELYREDRPPRIVFVPTTERIGPPTSIGGMDGVTDPRPLNTRYVTVEAHIWGNDGAEAERYLDILVQSLHDLAWGSDKIVGGSWSRAGEAKSDKGEVYVLSMEWDLVITRRPDTFATVTAMPLDPLTVDVS